MFIFLQCEWVRLMFYCRLECEFVIPSKTSHQRYVVLGAHGQLKRAAADHAGHC